MYEKMTYDVIMKQMLDRVPKAFDKREGSIIYDALAPAAAELTQLYIQLDVVLDQTFADTATNEYLDKRCSERGIIRTPATYAVVQGEFTPATIDVVGQRFSCSNYNYIVTESTGVPGIYQMVCETAGEAPNAVSGQLIPINYVKGLETAYITDVLIPGEDEESDDSLRERYFDSLSSQAFGGNVADYENKTKAIDGVGGVKVTPTPGGVGGTVLLTIIASDYSVPTSTLIGKVQSEIESIAPIGHIVTVDGVTARTINISTEITYESGWNWSSAGGYIEAAIDEYFRSLAEIWEDGTLVVRISGIEQKILSCAGVIDVQNTTLNGTSSNILLDVFEIPVRGDVSDGS